MDQHFCSMNEIFPFGFRLKLTLYSRKIRRRDLSGQLTLKTTARTFSDCRMEIKLDNYRHSSKTYHYRRIYSKNVNICVRLYRLQHSEDFWDYLNSGEFSKSLVKNILSIREVLIIV
jgi:hypothetical protein